jgi:hypothetical protein
MAKQIFYRHKSTSEEWLTLDDDGMLTHETEPEGWAMARSTSTKQRYTKEEAKLRWPEYANDIADEISP